MNYLFPPRPNKAVHPSQLDYYQRRGWQAEVKKNGTCTVIFISPTGEIQIYNRHEQILKWALPRELGDFLRERFRKETVLVAELLHFKTVMTKNTLYFFDMLVHEGKSLEGTKLSFRKHLLEDSFGDPRPTGIWLAQAIPGSFSTIFRGLQTQNDEGLVIKNPEGILKDLSRSDSNSVWQVKCRRPQKNFGC